MNRTQGMTNAFTLVLGTFFGVALSLIGFTSWDEVHAMFTFADLRLVLTFATAVVILASAWAIWSRVGERPSVSRPIHRGTLVGGMLFGAGWAISGACPSIAFVQLGEGQLGAIFALVGMFVGNALFAFANGRIIHIPTSGCAAEE